MMWLKDISTAGHGRGCCSMLYSIRRNQVNEIQAQLLGAAFTLAFGGPAEVHVGTGTGGSSSDLPWNDNVAKKHTSIKRR